MREACPYCGNYLVLPFGPPESKVYLLGEFPNFIDIENGIPWSPGRDRKITAGDVLRKELNRVGITPSRCRMNNVWQHAVDNKGCDPAWHVEQARNDIARAAKAVLLMGSEAARIFLNQNITEVATLRVKSKIMPKGVEVIVASINPAFVLQREGVGEIRLALERFAKYARKYE